VSLPSGINNRPAMIAPHPRVVGGILQRALRIGLVLLPLLVHVVFQVPGVRWCKEGAQLEAQIAQEQLRQRTLRVELTELLAPQRLKAEAIRLELAPPAAADRPTVLTPARVAQARR
jgi:hypothetical protein